ncbi:hypothetical protein PoB_006834900 [Plakobranchus ocellatus]|uniref:Uncharacterized protein n=1 Tax=Plakobranchus ocellatus TaxID=259542 RepID=A0AAV4DCA3_9GAST|nr:hypothetical protein PoB_006834900 [Plakobranchus ocellatus]
MSECLNFGGTSQRLLYPVSWINLHLKALYPVRIESIIMPALLMGSLMQDCILCIQHFSHTSVPGLTSTLDRTADLVVGSLAVIVPQRPSVYGQSTTGWSQAFRHSVNSGCRSRGWNPQQKGPCRFQCGFAIYFATNTPSC